MERGIFHRHGNAFLAVALLAAPLFIWASTSALGTISNDTRQWLPESYSETRRQQEFVDRFGAREAIIVSWEGCTLES